MKTTAMSLLSQQQKKEKMIVYKGSIQPSMVCETPAVYEGNLWKRLSQSKFRSSFSLKANDRSYVSEKGMEKVREHACDFIRKRLAPAEISNDGKQTPMRGTSCFCGTACYSYLLQRLFRKMASYSEKTGTHRNRTGICCRRDHGMD